MVSAAVGGRLRHCSHSTAVLHVHDAAIWQYGGRRRFPAIIGGVALIDPQLLCTRARFLCLSKSVSSSFHWARDHVLVAMGLGKPLYAMWLSQMKTGSDKNGEN